MSEIGKMDLTSENVVDDRLAKLKELMPEVFSESGIDFDKLRLELGDEIDEGQERYAFTWPGKMDAIRQSQTVSEATLRPCVEKSRGRDGEDGSFDSDNIYIEGDNLEVLKLLQRGYHGKVKMIYIDPPYNTGHDFVYKDKFGDTIENYKEQAGLAGQSNAETSGRFHSDWCSMMYPRLRLARELLSDDGLLFASIDDNEAGNLRSLLDEIFGEANRVAQIVTVANPGGRDYGQIAVMHEYILVYSKGYGGEIKMLPADKKFRYSDSRGGYEARELRNRNPKFTKANRPNLYYPFYVDPNEVDQYGYCSVSLGKDESHSVEVFPLNAELKDSCWRWGMPRSESAIHNDPTLSDVVAKRVNSGKWNIYEKSRLALTKVKSVWSETPMRTEDGTRETNGLFPEAPGIFDHPKSVELIQKCIKLAINDGDMMMDFFSGSATTMQAAFREALGGVRLRCILVQLPESCPNESVAGNAMFMDLCQIAEERIRRAGNKIKVEVEVSNKQLKLGEEPKKLPDIGFRVFTLDNSGIEKPEPGKLVLDVVKPGRSDMDIVFEMMLKWGLELTLPVEQEEATGYPIYSVACGELVCCLAPGLTIEALEAIADIEPRRVLMRDSILTDSLKLNAAQIFKRVAEKTGCEVELRTV